MTTGIIPASAQAFHPFHYLSSHSGANLSMGHPSIAIAINGFPPMAYTSLKALVAAILPKVNVVYYGQEKNQYL
jgi:hypothetical protein